MKKLIIAMIAALAVSALAFAEGETTTTPPAPKHAKKSHKKAGKTAAPKAAAPKAEAPAAPAAGNTGAAQ